LHAPYNKYTHHMINKENIKLIKKGAVLINTARGGLVETDAIVEALIQGRTIKEALSIAGTKYPVEAIKWDDGNIGDIAAHYDYLREHYDIMTSLKKQGKI
jgi:hypothetical protein